VRAFQVILFIKAVIFQEVDAGVSNIKETLILLTIEFFFSSYIRDREIMFLIYFLFGREAEGFDV
jgi:hypothetical protein